MESGMSALFSFDLDKEAIAFMGYYLE